MCRLYRRRLLLLVFVAVALAPWPATAQISTTLSWDEEAPSTVTGYRVSVDGAWQDFGSSPVKAGACGCSVSLSLAAGLHTFVVAAYNAAGATNSAPLVATVVALPPPPAAPGAPTSPGPANGATAVSTSAGLTWSATGATSYDVRLGTNNPPPLLASNLTTPSLNPSLAADTTYYWQIVARNIAGSTTGPVWSFTTAKATTGGDVPPPWTNEDIGNVGVAGSATYSNGTFTLAGGGAAIWGTSDAFQYVFQPLTGDGQIVARVTAPVQNTNTYARAGVMIRETLSASSEHTFLSLRPNGAIEFISRTSTGGSSSLAGSTTQQAPVWLKLVRGDDTVTASVSTNGTSWSVVGSSTVSMASSVTVGLVVCSHVAGTLNTSTFESATVTATTPGLPPGTPASPSPTNNATAVSTSTALTWSATGATTYDVRLGTGNPPSTVASNLQNAAYQPAGQAVPAAGTKYYWQILARNASGTTLGPVWSFTTASSPTGGALPSPWTNQDIGNVNLSGSATQANGTFTVTGGGGDLWGTVDGFQYVYQPLPDDGEIVARVTDIENTSSDAKAGLMMRAALTGSARHVTIAAEPTGNVEFIQRSSTSGSTTQVGRAAQSRPTWLKLTRVGSTVTGSVSSDGRSWSVVGSTSVWGLAYVGLAVTSSNTSARNDSTFDRVSVQIDSSAHLDNRDIVIHASLARAGLPGSPQKASGRTTSQKAVKLTKVNGGVRNADNPFASPTDNVDTTFSAAAGRPYSVSARSLALHNRANDSGWTPFSDLRVNGSPAHAVAATSGDLPIDSKPWPGITEDKPHLKGEQGREGRMFLLFQSVP